MTKKKIDIELAANLKDADAVEAVESSAQYNQGHLSMYEECSKLLQCVIKELLHSKGSLDVGILQKLVAAIEKVQKGQRVALGLDNQNAAAPLPKINIVTNLDEDKV